VIISKKIEVVVGSYGGVGTTFLMNFLSNYFITNSYRDRDNIKHHPIPPITFNKKTKYIYIYGNPEIAAISLFRRNIHRAQSDKLLQFKGFIHRIPANITLDQYAQEGVDRFLFREHFYNWYDEHQIQPTFFVKYEKIFDNLEPLFEFLDIPKEDIKKFPKKKQRHSNLDTIPTQTRENLNKIYLKFNSDFKKFPDYEVRDSKRSNQKIKHLLKLIYIYSIFKQLLFHLKKKLSKTVPKFYTLLHNKKNLYNKTK